MVMELKVLVLFLWSCSAPVQSSRIQKKYSYHPEPKTREEAQLFCQETYGGDLATVGTNADLWDLDLNMYYAWFGKRKVQGTWQSVSTDQNNDSQNRKKRNVPVEGDEPGKDCGKLQYSKDNVFAENCSQKHFVFCEFGYSAQATEYFIPKTMSWADGLLYCQNEGYKYMYIASLELSMNYPGSEVHSSQEFPVWIGLNHRDPALNPDPSSGLCVAVDSQSKDILQENCTESYPFICDRSNLVLLKEELTWENALETCRNLKKAYNFTSFSLFSMEEDDREFVQSYIAKASTSKVWVGLRFLAGSWFWLDNVANVVPSSPLFNLPSCPEFTLGCGALVVSSSDSDPVIEPTDCSEKLNVLCYGSEPQ